MTIPPTQPTLDAGRRTLTLPRRLVPVVMLLGTEPGVDDGAVTLKDLVELERAGIAEDRKLHPLAARMLDVVTNPRRVITVHVERGDSTELSTIWVRHANVVMGRPAGSDSFELRPLEYGLLTFHLTQLVGVTPRPEPHFAGSVTVPAALLDDAVASLGADPELAARMLVDEGVDSTWADRIVTTHQHLAARWRIATLGVADGRPHDETYDLFDSGPAGFWQVLADPAGAGYVTLATRRFVDVLELLDAVASERDPLPD